MLRQFSCIILSFICTIVEEQIGNHQLFWTPIPLIPLFHYGVGAATGGSSIKEKCSLGQVTSQELPECTEDLSNWPKNLLLFGGNSCYLVVVILSLRSPKLLESPQPDLGTTTEYEFSGGGLEMCLKLRKQKAGAWKRSREAGPPPFPPASFPAEDLAMKEPEKNSQSLEVSTKYILRVMLLTI